MSNLLQSIFIKKNIDDKMEYGTNISCTVLLKVYKIPIITMQLYENISFKSPRDHHCTHTN